MATQRRIGWMVALLVALAVIAYASGTFDAAPTTVDVPTITVETEDITGIEITRPEFSLHAQKTNGNWQLTEPEPWLADSSTISSFARSIAELSLESVVSLNPERYGRYGVDSTGSEVVVEMGAGNLHLIVSSEGPDFSTSYVRLDNDERVFVARPRVSLPSDVNRWRNRIVTQIPVSMVESVSVRSGEGAFSIQQSDSGWQFEADGETLPADSAGVANWLSAYNSLRADGFLDMDAMTDSLVHEVDFTLTGGEHRSFTISQRESELAVQFSGNARAVYRFFSSRKSALLPDVDAIRGSE